VTQLPTTSAGLVSLRNVGVRYRRRRGFLRGKGDVFWALRDISLDLGRGEALGLVGRNGAGKTTLLKLLAGLIRPDQGTLATTAHRATLLSLQVGFVPQLTGRENVVLSGLLLGLRRRDIERRMEQILRFADIDDFIDQPIDTYSAGMRARLGFAVALECESEILLIDETLGVGDADFQRKCWAVLEERVHSAKTVVLASHSAAAIRQLCTRAVWIERGHTRADGDTATVLAAYEAFLRRLAVDGGAPSAGGTRSLADEREGRHAPAVG
jgi:lipopolysaccharide transport system ATP-binding protein